MIGIFNFSIVWKHFPYLIDGAIWTCVLSAAILMIALPIGLLICMLNISGWRPLSYVGTAYIQVFRNIPALVILVWVYYCSAIFLRVNVDAITASILAFGLLMAANMAEVFRSGILSVDKGEILAGRSLGMSSYQIMSRIVLPQAVRTMIPDFVNQTVITFKTTTIAVIIAVPELLYRAKTASSVTFHPMEFYTTIGVMYFVICLVLSRIADYLQGRLVRYRQTLEVR